MKTLKVIQGSPEWKAARVGKITASLAPEIMGDGYGSYNQAIENFLGVEKQIGDYQQKIFDDGHAAEEKARPLAETLIGEDISPEVYTEIIDGIDIEFLYSSDGATFDLDLLWEHKHTDKSYDEQIQKTRWQFEIGFLVTGATKGKLTLTRKEIVDDNGDPIIEHFDYEHDPALREQLLKAVKKFLKDAEKYERSDQAWISSAQEYINLDRQIKVLKAKQDEHATALRELAGRHTSKGAGVTVSVSEVTEKKQTPDDYIKKNKIELATIKLDEPVYNYRINVKKDVA